MKVSQDQLPLAQFVIGAAPANPAAGMLRLYAKTGGVMAYRTSAGTEVLIIGTADPDVNAVVDASGTTTIDLSLGTLFAGTLTANTTLAVTNPPAAGKGKTFSLRLKQHASAAKTVSLPASFHPISGSDTTMPTTLDGYAMLVATSFDAGTRWEYSWKECGP